MTLPGMLLDVWLGVRARPQRFDATLVRSGREVAGPVPFAPGRWTRDDDEAAVDVTFGPFPAGVDFDTVRLRADGEPVGDMPMGDVARLPAGGTWTHTVRLRVG